MNEGGRSPLWAAAHRKKKCTDTSSEGPLKFAKTNRLKPFK